MADVWIKQDDTLPILERVLVDTDGQPVDLSAADVVFNMADMYTHDVLIVGAPAIIEGDPGTGAVTYAWQPGDTSIPGGYYGEFQVTFVNGSVETFPNDRPGFRIAIVSELEAAS